MGKNKVTGYNVELPTATAVSGYPAPYNPPTATPTALVAPTVLMAANAISPANAANLWLAAPIGPPSFLELQRFFAEDSWFSWLGPVVDSAFSPDGTLLAVAAPYGVYVYDLRSATPLRFIETANAFPFRVFFLADSKTIMVSTGDDSYRPLGATFFDVKTGQRAGVVRVGPGWQAVAGTASRISPDGRTLVIQQGNSARFYDPSTWRLLPFWPDWVPLASYAFSPDGRLVAAGFGAVTVWALDTHRVYFNATAPNTSAVQHPAVTFSPDGSLFATTDWHRLVIWDVGQRQLLFDVPISGVFPSTGSALAFAPDNSIVTLATDRQVATWRVPSGQLALKTSDVGALFSPDGSAMLMTSDHNTITVWDVAALQQRFELAGNAPQFAPDGRLLIRLGANSYGFADIHTGQVQPGFFAVRPRFAPDGRLLDISDDASVRILDGSGQTVQTLRLQPEHSPMTSVAFLRDGRLLMAFGNGTLRLQTDDPQLISNPFTVGERGAWVYQVVPAPDGKSVLAASKDGTLARFLADGYLDVSPQDEFGGSPGELTSAAVSTDGLHLAAGSSDGTVKLWEAASPAITPTQTLAGHTSWVWSVAFSPDGKRLASGSADQTVRLWDVGTGATMRVLAGHTGAVHSVVYSPDGSLVASGSWDGTVRLWDAASGALLRSLTAGQARVNQVAFSRDGQVVAAAVDDGTVRLWDSATGRSLATLHPDGGAVWAIAFSADGRRLAATMNDGNAQLWEAP